MKRSRSAGALYFVDIGLGEQYFVDLGLGRDNATRVHIHVFVHIFESTFWEQCPVAHVTLPKSGARARDTF